MLAYRCMVCGYDEMPSPPQDYNICPCCGVEYGLDDVFDTYRDLREEWLAAGGKWFSRHPNQKPPMNWSAWEQLDLAEFEYSIPSPSSNISTTIAPSHPVKAFDKLLTKLGVEISFA